MNRANNCVLGHRAEPDGRFLVGPLMDYITDQRKITVWVPTIRGYKSIVVLCSTTVRGTELHVRSLCGLERS